MERDAENGNDYFAVIISTHTLTWSVTQLAVNDKQYKTISTHTLTWSVTSQQVLDLIAQSISTHTLTWSVTIANLCALLDLHNFNSHAHVERDVGLDFDVNSIREFQLTRSRGA